MASPLNPAGRLGGYCHGLVPRVPWAAGYDPKNLNMTWFPPMVNGCGTKYPIPDMTLPLLGKEEGPPTKKNCTRE
jgi:hypothetical protein